MDIEDIKKELEKDLDGVDLKSLQDVKNKYLGKKGLVSDLTKDMASLSIEENRCDCAALRWRGNCLCFALDFQCG